MKTLKPYLLVNLILRIAWNNGDNITSFKLNKLLQIVHGYYLAFNNEPLLSEPICASYLGPMIISLISYFSDSKGAFINEYIETNDIENILGKDDLSDITNLVNEVYRAYGSLSELQLSTILHRKDSFWDIATEGGMNFGVITEEGPHMIINNSIIRDYYVKHLAANNQNLTEDNT